MQLSVWTYEGPSHVGAMRVAAAMPGVHLVLHAPQGDTYADLLFTMIERRATRPPVTYTTFGARDLGKDTAALFQNALAEAYERFRPEAIVVGSSCTAELIQDDPGGLARALALPVPVVPVEFHSYQRKENWGAAETFYALVRTFTDAAPSIQAKQRHPVSTDAALSPSLRAERSNPGSTGAAAIEDGLTPEPLGPGSAGLLRSARNDDEGGPAARHEAPARRPRCNILGPTSLGFRHRDDVAEVTRILEALGIEIGVTAPLGASPADLARLGEADFNVVLYPEIADTAARWLKRRFGQPFTTIVPIGVGATERFIAEVATLAGVDAAPALSGSRLPWFSRSVDSTYLTGKRVFVFGDAAHAVASARVARDEFGFEVVGLGSYSREFARDVRAAAADFGLTALITDDSLEVEAEIVRLQPELVLGTQMERHVAKRLKIACAVISAPVHVQDFPARYSPQMGFEGANVLWDSWVHPLMMGLEEHLLGMFREDPEFHDGAAASHLGVSGDAAKAADLLPLRGECGSAEGRDGWGLAARGAAPEGLATPPVTPAACHPPLEGEGARSDPVAWSTDAERELKKIPFFVRGKARRNTEAFAEAGGLCEITLETLYDAKAHFSGR